MRMFVPHFFDQSAYVNHGSDEGMLRRLPMMGSRGGPGGSFLREYRRFITKSAVKTVAAAAAARWELSLRMSPMLPVTER